MMNIEKVKLTLENKLTDLVKRAKEIDAELDVPADDDWAENATESEGDEVDEKVGNMMLQEISQIKQALIHIKAGTYGECEICTKPIPPERMQALPYATKCVGCS